MEDNFHDFLISWFCLQMALNTGWWLPMTSPSPALCGSPGTVHSTAIPRGPDRDLQGTHATSTSRGREEIAQDCLKHSLRAARLLTLETTSRRGQPAVQPSTTQQFFLSNDFVLTLNLRLKSQTPAGSLNPAHIRFSRLQIRAVCVHVQMHPARRPKCAAVTPTL